MECLERAQKKKGPPKRDEREKFVVIRRMKVRKDTISSQNHDLIPISQLIIRVLGLLWLIRDPRWPCLIGSTFDDRRSSTAPISICVRSLFHDIWQGMEPATSRFDFVDG